MTYQLSGVVTHVPNINLWRMCHEKLESLSFTCKHRNSVPMDATVIDTENRTFWDVWLENEIDQHFIAFDDVRWLHVADLLSWERTLSEEEALLAFADMWHSGRTEEFEDLLSTDFQYNSNWVTEELTSKYAFKRSIQARLNLLAESEQTIRCKLRLWLGRPCLVLAQEGTQAMFQATAFATVAGGMITDIEVGSEPQPDLVLRSHPHH